MSTTTLATASPPEPDQLHTAIDATIGVDCPLCNAQPGTLCLHTIRTRAMHLVRFARARSRGLLTLGEMGAVFDGLASPAFKPSSYVLDPRP